MIKNYKTVFTDDDGTSVYQSDGCLHRLDGPAIELKDGTGYFYINHIRLSLDHWIETLYNLKCITEEEKTLLFLEWAGKDLMNNAVWKTW